MVHNLLGLAFSFSIMLRNSSMLLHESIVCSLLLLSSILWYGYTMVCLTIHPLKSSGLFLAITNKAVINIMCDFCI